MVAFSPVAEIAATGAACPRIAKANSHVNCNRIAAGYTDAKASPDTAGSFVRLLRELSEVGKTKLASSRP
jgi:hypothetical protein